MYGPDRGSLVKIKEKHDLHNDIGHFEIVILTKELEIVFIIQDIFKYNGWI